MARVKCPICDEEVMGEDTEGLTLNLRKHLADAHEMVKLLRSERGAHGNVQEFIGTSEKWGGPKEEEFIGTSKEFEGQKGRPGEEEYIGTSKEWEAQKGKPKEEEFIGTSKEYERQKGRPGEEEYIGTSKEFTGQKGRPKEEEFIGTPETFEEGKQPMIHCPLCGELLTGASEDDLSGKLKNHMTVTHDIKPKMMKKKPL